MEQEKTEQKFHHALRISAELCTGCTHCMKVCPTQAIRISKGKAVISEERCVDCGECYKACPVSAIMVEQDDFGEIFNYKVRVALVPAVFIGQFPSAIPASQVYAGLAELGFTHVFEIESVTGIIQEGYRRFMEKNPGYKPYISTFCPAIIRLIQVRFPSMTDHLLLVKPPNDVAAQYFRNKLEQEGFSGAETGMFYITPCAAKIAAVKKPVGEDRSAINGVINMDYLYNRVLRLIRNNEIKTAGNFQAGFLSSTGIRWTLTRGESSVQKGRSLAVDGMSHVTEFLEKLEETENSSIDFLELRACDESCAGGILISGNRFLTVERLVRRASDYPETPIGNGEEAEMYHEESYDLKPILPRPMMQLDSDISAALEKMARMEQLLKVLPGIDCGGCGSPGCRALAEDIVRGKAGLSRCIFIQELQIRDGRLSVEEADRINAEVWGADRKYRSQNI
ncbi:MAG: [Fe-Fe] hydrogenase large subunit C-terminal domain-containing protein [Bacteroidota bacterium]